METWSKFSDTQHLINQETTLVKSVFFGTSTAMHFHKKLYIPKKSLFESQHITTRSIYHIIVNFDFLQYTSILACLIPLRQCLNIQVEKHVMSNFLITQPANDVVDTYCLCKHAFMSFSLARQAHITDTTLPVAHSANSKRDTSHWNSVWLTMTTDSINTSLELPDHIEAGHSFSAVPAISPLRSVIIHAWLFVNG
jgi:hypothetical protein